MGTFARIDWLRGSVGVVANRGEVKVEGEKQGAMASHLDSLFFVDLQ